jgi:hypothetical protein
LKTNTLAYFYGASPTKKKAFTKLSPGVGQVVEDSLSKLPEIEERPQGGHRLGQRVAADRLLIHRLERQIVTFQFKLDHFVMVSTFVFINKTP